MASIIESTQPSNHEVFDNLRLVVRENLEYQHYWTDLQLVNTVGDFRTSRDPNQTPTSSPQPSTSVLSILPRPLIYGRPPEQLYNPEPAKTTHSKNDVQASKLANMEYVLAVHLEETLTLRKWAAIFDALPDPVEGNDHKKRIVVAVVSGDSTVVYYIMHDGIVKPRQN